MQNYKLIISYDGTNYNGWQKQGNTPNTIQAVMEEKLSSIYNKKIQIHGSGRTDAGVHAYQQHANYISEDTYNENEIRSKLNTLLPEDIRIQEVQKVNPSFHCRYNALSKQYVYRIDTSEKPCVFTRKYAYWVETELNLNDMRTASSHLVGSHNFKSFTSENDRSKSTKRIIEDVQIEKVGNEVRIRVKGNGFLHNMVRIIAGTLIEVGNKTKKPDETPMILAKHNRQSAGFTAPPHGLFLEKVWYPENSKVIK